MIVSAMAPDRPSSAGFVQNYCLLIGDKSFSNFQKVGPIFSLPFAAADTR